MNQKEIIQSIANLIGLPKRAIQDVLETASDVVAETLAEGSEDVTLAGFGKFKSTRRALRRIVLPNGEERQVGGKRVARFVPAAKFRARVNGEI